MRPRAGISRRWPNFPLTIPADQTSGTAQFTFEPVDDDVFEDDEKVRVAGTASGTTLTVSGTDLTIIEDDAKGIVLSPMTPLTVTEGGNNGRTPRGRDPTRWRSPPSRRAR